MRNEDGKVLLHGRSSFIDVYSKLDASLEAWTWAIESLKTLHLNAILSVGEDLELIGTISKPSSWSFLKFYSTKVFIYASKFFGLESTYSFTHRMISAVQSLLLIV